MKNLSLFFIVSLLFTSLIFAQTTSSDDFMTEKEKAILEAVNKARRNPSFFANKYIEPLKDKSEAAKECYYEMIALRSIPDLKPSIALTKAARDHVADIGPKGLNSHNGSDNSSPWDRIARYGQWSGKAGENIQYGYDDAIDIVVNLLVDEHTPSRGHRKNILSKEYNYIGTALGEHKKYQYVSVMDFAGEITEKKED